MDKLWSKIERLEYHQKLLLKMIKSEGHEFDRLIIEKNLDEKETAEFYLLCEELSKEAQKQKADKFVFFAPLFIEFLYKLNPKLEAVEVIDACLKQNIYPQLMKILQKNL
ncbi:DUF1878 family protein [Lederbergia citrea]|uniref:DUF1878 family protein n=1 Tax=Lederbergia citrea TaxID=2833581 RepID=A0A942Z2A0_9BACI|nr:DUF1878 family protein [Lederbergia citrea]MBS4177508.1 DUF1878 family protein [Lederbergia citrea]MBS4204181.1 DUF1878 family protein [Lederbergia citrea]MBS4221234.1 DUF1878 family protein [Lederbergia citrea]